MSAADWNGRRLHFIGIGGAGMSGLALVCMRLGAEVTGSDRADSSYMERLRDAGLEPVIGHDAASYPEGAEVVVSTAIAEDNPERARARELGAPELHRGELLAQICKLKRLIAVAGTHGKTTTTAMIVWALRGLGEDPAFFIGGEVPGLGPDGAAANAGWGDGEWVVAEADESDASFRQLMPEIAVITNVEMDHHSHWGSLGELVESFRSFIFDVADGVVLSVTDPRQGRIREFESPVDILYGAAVKTKRVERFSLSDPGPASLELAVLGEHNALNARAALAALKLAGWEGDLDAAGAALATFPGAKRRLEYKGRYVGSRVFDDYAHHPTEVRAALEALRAEAPTSLIAVFQPHLFSRTKFLAEEFGAALAIADEVIVLDVYPAREEPVGDLAGVTGKLVVDAAADRMGGRSPWWTPAHEEALSAVRSSAGGEGQIIVTIGAGDVFRIGEALVAEGAR